MHREYTGNNENGRENKKMKYIITSYGNIDNVKWLDENRKHIADYGEYCLDGIDVENHRELIGNATKFEELPDDFKIEECDEQPLAGIGLAIGNYGDFYRLFHIPKVPTLKKDSRIGYVTIMGCAEEIREECVTYLLNILRENQLEYVFVCNEWEEPWCRYDDELFQLLKTKVFKKRRQSYSYLHTASVSELVSV